MIYTSYFRNFKRVPNPIAISRGVPKWYTGNTCDLLAPSWELLNGIHDGSVTKLQYTTRYLKELIDRGLTKDRLKEIIPDGCTLLCWEKPEDFCHRHIVAYILKCAGADVKEWEECDAREILNS